MGLFGKTRYLDPNVEDWCLETWGWLMANLGAQPGQRLALVTPTPEFFPPTAAEGHERALYVFERVKTLMGLADFACELEVFSRKARPQRVGLFGKDEREETPGGAYRLEDGKAVIAYAADLVARPETLIATLSHELARARLAAIPGDVPGGVEFGELATELALAFCGFGLFGLGGAYQPVKPRNPFAQREIAFPEPIWAFSVALFAALRGIEVPKAGLKPAPADLTLKAERYFKRNQDLLEPLRAVA
jgi:hypothetical protein